MDKKRTKAVTFVAWLVIVLSVLGLSGVRGLKSFSFLPKLSLLTLIVYAIAFNIAGIIGGIKLLKLKEWSRKLLLLLAIVGILDTFAFISLNNRAVEEALSSNRNTIQEQIAKGYDDMSMADKAQIKMTKEEFVSVSMDRISKIGHITVVIVELFGTLLYSLPILVCLTRPKVKEQFA